MRHPALRFALVFVACLGAFSVLLRLDAAERLLVVPFTGLLARASKVVLNLMGMGTRATGTVIAGGEGFSVNILEGCNGVYVTAILIAAVMAFPSTWREKGIGLALGVPGVQAINFVRIVSLYYIGLRWPALFDRFHYYVWQTGVIMVSMAIWIFWAEVLVAPPATRAGGRRAAGG